MSKKPFVYVKGFYIYVHLVFPEVGFGNNG